MAPEVLQRSSQSSSTRERAPENESVVSLAEFRERRSAGAVAPPTDPRPASEVDWPSVWWWAREVKGEDRVFPQLLIGGDVSEKLTDEEYLVLYGEWLRAGSPPPATKVPTWPLAIDTESKELSEQGEMR